MPDLREQFRCVTVFEDFDVYEHYETRTLSNYTNLGMARSSFEYALEDADAQLRLQRAGYIRPIKSQYIEHRYISDWEEAP